MGFDTAEVNPRKSASGPWQGWQKHALMVSFRSRRNSVLYYKCPACDCLPVRYKSKPPSQPSCLRCGRDLVKVSNLKKGYLWAAGLAGAGMALITIPDLILHYGLLQNNLFNQLNESLSPGNAQTRITEPVHAGDLLKQLEQADLQWRPQEEILADGSTRYLYKRREGEADLTVSELQHLMKSPPTFQQEQRSIVELLNALRGAGAKVVIAPTIKDGAAAEWDHHLKMLRIQPKIVEKGSVDFLLVLAHEAIHVAQSCKAGSLQSQPKSLGIHVDKRSELLAKLKDKVYANTTHWEQELELEAYAAQKNIPLVKALLTRECRLA